MTKKIIRSVYFKIATTVLCVVPFALEYLQGTVTRIELILAIGLNLILATVLFFLLRRKEWARKTYLLYWCLVDVPLTSHQLIRPLVMALPLPASPIIALHLVDFLAGGALSLLLCHPRGQEKYTARPARPLLRYALVTFSLFLGLGFSQPPPKGSPTSDESFASTWQLLDSAFQILTENSDTKAYAAWEKGLAEKHKNPDLLFLKGALRANVAQRTAVAPSALAALIALETKPLRGFADFERLLDEKNPVLRSQICRILLSPRFDAETTLKFVKQVLSASTSDLNTACLFVLDDKLQRRDEVREYIHGGLTAPEIFRRFAARQTLMQIAERWSYAELEPSLKIVFAGLEEKSDRDYLDSVRAIAHIAALKKSNASPIVSELRKHLARPLPLERFGNAVLTVFRHGGKNPEVREAVDHALRTRIATTKQRKESDALKSTMRELAGKEF